MAKFSPEEVWAEVQRQAPAADVPLPLAKAILLSENTGTGQWKEGSQFNGDAVSGKKARGIFQTLPQTEEALKRLGHLPPNWQFSPDDLRVQVQAGMAALKEMRGRQKNKQDHLETAAMYNGGGVNWRKYLGGEQLHPETTGYLQKMRVALGITEKPKMGAQAIEQAVQQPASASSGSAARTTSSKTSFDPAQFAAAMAQGFELVKAGGSIDTATLDILSAAEARKAAEMQQQQGIAMEADAAGNLATAQAATAGAAAARRKNILDAANMNPDMLTSDINAAFDTIARTDTALEPLGQEIDRRMSVGVFDNPLEWLVNQVRLPGMVGRFNAIANEQNRAISTAKTKQALITSQQSISTSMDADLIAREGVAAAAAAAGKAQEQLGRAQAGAAGEAARDAANISSLAVDKVKVALSLTELTKQRISEGHATTEREAKMQAVQITVDRVNNYLKMIGSSTVHTPESFTGTLSKATQDELVARSGTGIIAKTFSEAATVIDGAGNLGKIAEDGDAAMTTWFRGTTTEAQRMTELDTKLLDQQAKITGKVVKRDEILAGNMNKMQAIYAGETADMRTASQYNPYKIEYTQLIKDPKLAANPVALFISEFGPTSKQPAMTKIDEKVLLDRISYGIADGRYTTAQAAEFVTQFFQVGVDQQFRATKYGLFGMEKPKGYVVKIPKEGFFTTQTQPVGSLDLTNPAAVESHLTLATATRARAKLADTGPSGNTASWAREPIIPMGAR